MGQGFGVSLAAGLNGKADAEFVGAGNSGSWQHFFTVFVNGLQKLVGVSRETFFEENVGDREQGAVDVENDYLADVDGRILLNDIFYLEQIVLFLVGIK